jgi:hypothetical protein
MPREYLPLVPFTSKTTQTLKDNLKKGTPIPKGMQAIFNKRMTDKVKISKATEGGKCWYTLVTDVCNAVNKNNALPNFQPATIEALGYNFIQIYSNIKGGKLISGAFWPGMVDGVVVLKTKAGATDPYQGKLSFQISYGKKGKDVDESVIEPVVPTSVEKPKQLGNKKTLGRERQR